MLSKALLPLILLFINFLSGGPSFALTPESFDKSRFLEAQKSQKVVLVDVFAKWCPTCKAQHADLKTFLAEPKYKDVVVFRLDFDDKVLVKSFSDLIAKPIPRQSTIVVFSGTKLVAFSVAEQGAALKAQLDKAFP